MAFGKKTYGPQYQLTGVTLKVTSGQNSKEQQRQRKEQLKTVLIIYFKVSNKICDDMMIINVFMDVEYCSSMFLQ